MWSETTSPLKIFKDSQSYITLSPFLLCPDINIYYERRDSFLYENYKCCWLDYSMDVSAGLLQWSSTMNLRRWVLIGWSCAISIYSITPFSYAFVINIMFYLHGRRLRHPCHCVGHMAHVLRHGMLVLLRQLIRSSHQLGVRIRGDEISRFPRSPKRDRETSYTCSSEPTSPVRLDGSSRWAAPGSVLCGFLPHRCSVIWIW